MNANPAQPGTTRSYLDDVPRPILMIAEAMDYSPSLYLPGPSRSTIELATKLWEKLKANGYCADLVSDEGR